MANRELYNWVKTVYDKSHETYGSPRLRHELKGRGVVSSLNRAARLMRLGDVGVMDQRQDEGHAWGGCPAPGGCSGHDSPRRSGQPAHRRQLSAIPKDWRIPVSTNDAGARYDNAPLGSFLGPLSSE